MDFEASIYCWGSSLNGELSLGGIEEFILKPRKLSTFEKSNDIQDVICGRFHTVLILRDGTLYSCGNNDFGQLGHSLQTRKLQLISSLSAHSAWQVSCGESHTLVVTLAGEVFSWGNNSQGQLGLGVQDQTITIPRLIKSLAVCHKVVQVACGYHHSLALTENGSLFSWGQNIHGQLGIGKSENVEDGGGKDFCSSAREVISLKGLPIRQISAGGFHSFVLTKSGSIFSWGKNSFGQLGVGDCCDRHFPTQLKTMRYQKVNYIACGENHSAALTLSGGVFTFGWGMYGQLGHGNYSNEVLPKQVTELMGSVVTQIACGRCHSLSYIASQGRIYSFGLCGNGQLGTGRTDNRNNPSLVCGPPWSHHHPKETRLRETNRFIDKIEKRLRDVNLQEEMDWQQTTTTPIPNTPRDNHNEEVEENHDLDMIVHKIISGGNQSFVISTRAKALIEPDDFRKLSKENQILNVQFSLLQELCKIPAEKALPIDAICEIETVFTSVSCLNGSFLKEDHFGCNSKNPGLDFSQIYESFDQIENSKNTRLPELISNCMKELLSKYLRSTVPPDVEALRIYLLLPQSHFFHNLDAFLDSLVWPLASAIVNLNANASKIIDLWWSKLEERFFRNLVQIYTKSIVHVLTNSKNTDDDIYQSFPVTNQMRCFLEVLLKLNKVNIQMNQIVPYQEFYIPELSQRIDVTLDYIRWLKPFQNNALTASKLCICDYPFVFDGHAKTIILQMDSQIQMELASINSCRLSLSSNSILTSEPFLILQVSRDNLIDTAIAQLNNHPSSDLKKPLKVIFVGEEAVDAGGVRKEFFLLLLREILDPKYGMFKEYSETRCIWFNSQCFEDDTMYYVIGIVCGLAIYNFTIINLPFPLVLYKKILDEKIALEDLRGLSPSLAKGLQDLLDYENEEDFEEVFPLNFTISCELFGQIVTTNLKENGNGICVNQQNKLEYVELYVDFILNKSISNSFNAFSRGFLKVCGSRVLSLFYSQELMALVIGNEDYKWDELEKNAQYKNDYDKDSPYIRRFWKVFHSFDREEKKKFLLFLTGSDRIPILGMKAVKIIIQSVNVDDSHLPSAHTCFNLLDLPKYSNEKILRQKLLQAIENTRGFGLV